MKAEEKGGGRGQEGGEEIVDILVFNSFRLGLFETKWEKIHDDVEAFTKHL